MERNRDKGLKVAWIIEPLGETCKLTLEHHELPEGAAGIRSGWAQVLASLKSYLETGKGISFAA